LDLRGFVLGFALDRAIEELRQAGISSGKVSTDLLIRAFGDGPEGQGWKIRLPVPEGMDTRLDPIRLRDQAVAAIVPAFDHGRSAATLPLDFRDGSISSELLAVFAVTELAIDAEALGRSFFALGSREGEFRAGLLRPLPSLLWLFGSDQGNPLLSTARWSPLVSPKGSSPR
jgi:thiamine biosynthesis lipoprotein